MLREIRREHAPQLGAAFHATNLRSPGLRFGVHRGQNIASDFTLVARASPFLDRMERTGLTLLLEGRGRFDEHGQSGWLASGDLVINQQRRRGTEAYTGREGVWVVLEWQPAFAGASFEGPFRIESLSPRDRERAMAIARAFEVAPSPQHAAAMLDLLRAAGLPFERLRAADLEAQSAAETEQRLTDSVMTSLAHLERFPAIEDVVGALGWNARTVHRRLERVAERYVLPWSHWRSALHHTRITQAVRWLGAPGATTELVAKLTGFRSPTALCHAFADAGLPSPGTLARAARRDPLLGWAPSAVPLGSLLAS